MLRILLCGLTAFALTSFAGLPGPAQASETSRISPLAVSDQVIHLSQATMRQSPSGQVRLPARVPAGKTFAIQLGTQTTFNRFSAGATLPGTDCVQITCPSSFEPDVVCWKCVESLTAPSR